MGYESNPLRVSLRGVTLTKSTGGSVKAGRAADRVAADSTSWRASAPARGKTFMLAK